jgi:hypothetical protein
MMPACAAFSCPLASAPARPLVNACLPALCPLACLPLQVQDRPDVAPLQGWEQEDKVHLLNLAYDLTPADFVTVVVTEMGAVPPTSVAVILREAQRDIGMM